MFNVYTKLGKLYVFDIQRTYREVYDHARRVLHVNVGECCGTPVNGNSTDDALHKMEKEVAERISEALTCRICMDREINTSFTPCGHITSCQSCAEK